MGVGGTEWSVYDWSLRAKKCGSEFAFIYIFVGVNLFEYNNYIQTRFGLWFAQSFSIDESCSSACRYFLADRSSLKRTKKRRNSWTSQTMTDNLTNKMKKNHIPHWRRHIFYRNPLRSMHHSDEKDWRRLCYSSRLFIKSQNSNLRHESLSSLITKFVGGHK